MSTVYERIYKKLDNIERKAVKVAEKRIRHERI
jgi:hypothetical protein